MSLPYAPRVGAIVMCAFPDCFAPPEMVKVRPVVVISPRLHGRAGLVAVVPLSTTRPDPLCAHHVSIPARLMPPCFQASSTERWAKCDMLYTLSLDRLSLVQGRRNRKTGKRSYEESNLDLSHIRAVRVGIASALGITGDLFHGGVLVAGFGDAACGKPDPAEVSGD